MGVRRLDQAGRQPLTSSFDALDPRGVQRHSGDDLGRQVVPQLADGQSKVQCGDFLRHPPTLEFVQGVQAVQATRDLDRARGPAEQRPVHVEDVQRAHAIPASPAAGNPLAV
jgi:hypothetical protein